tara:strand:- start:536 stop:1378 length:843 start_codon:yes stop_codon:yes gene_type:complete
MINKNEKGFALVLSLVLLLVMSLMGGALIVISSGDHQSNNSSDQYQQAFYVAETGLLEAEKTIINAYMGPYVDIEDLSVDDPGVGATEEEQLKFNSWLTYKDKLNMIVQTTETLDEAGMTIKNSNNYARDFQSRGMPRNNKKLNETSCSLSFKNLVRPTAPEVLEVAHHITNQGFYDLISPIFPTGDSEETATNVDAIATGKQIKKERDFLKRFRYEYFSINIGTATYYGSGSSIKKKSSDAQSQGTAYKIYACGIMTESTDSNVAEIIIPLESLIVMPN